MSGRAWEYVMGVFANSSGDLWSGGSISDNSGFTGKLGSSGTDYTEISFTESKYYDVYKATIGISISPRTACNSGICYGHALSATSGWYGDYKYFVSSSSPWFWRGGGCRNDTVAGVFSFGDGDGSIRIGNSFRVVLS